MPTYIPIPINGIVSTGKPKKTETYHLDFDKHRMTSRHIDDLEAVNQYIFKALMTPRFKCLIYSTQYGSQVAQLITNTPSRAYLEASIYDIVLDAIIHDERVLSMPRESFTVVFEGDTIKVNGKVNTIYGETRLEEVFVIV